MAQKSNPSTSFREFVNVRLQITSGGYTTKHGQAIRTEFIDQGFPITSTCYLQSNHVSVGWSIHSAYRRHVVTCSDHDKR